MSLKVTLSRGLCFLLHCQCCVVSFFASYLPTVPRSALVSFISLVFTPNVSYIYLGRGGFVLPAVCLFVCLFACLLVTSRNTNQIIMKIYQRCIFGQEKTDLIFEVNSHPRLDPDPGTL